MTGMLGREALEAVAIVAVTTAALSARQAGERSGLAADEQRGRPSTLAVVLALGAVALVAAVAVVVVFGVARRDALDSHPPAQPTRSRSPERPSSPAQFAQQ